MRSTLTVLLAVAVLAVPGLACQTTEGISGKATNVAADLVLPPAQEEQLGEEFSKSVEQELTLHPNPQVQAYVTALGEAAVAASGQDAPDPIEFEFHVIEEPDVVNAFAGPGGQLYVYSGLLLEADNAAEVMGVMAHEVAHVTERHIAEQLAAQYGLRALVSAALGQDPGVLAQMASSIAAQGFLLKYSRDMERQADHVGFGYMTETVYDPVGMVSFFKKLGGATALPTFLQSHPSPEERIDYLKEMLAVYGDPPNDFLGDREHAEIVEILKEGQDEEKDEEQVSSR